MVDIINSVRDSNQDRKFENLHRRILKLGEEFGEVSEAYLSVSSQKNSKNKTWDNVREELVDLLVITIDTLLIQLPIDKTEVTNETIINLLNIKLNKWQKKKEK